MMIIKEKTCLNKKLLKTSNKELKSINNNTKLFQKKKNNQ